MSINMKDILEYDYYEDNDIRLKIYDLICKNMFRLGNRFSLKLDDIVTYEMLDVLEFSLDWLDSEVLYMYMYVKKIFNIMS